MKLPTAELLDITIKMTTYRILWVLSNLNFIKGHVKCVIINRRRQFNFCVNKIKQPRVNILIRQVIKLIRTSCPKTNLHYTNKLDARLLTTFLNQSAGIRVIREICVPYPNFSLNR